MNHRLIAAILGRLISFASLTLLIPFAYALSDSFAVFSSSGALGTAWTDSGLSAFAITIVISFGLGLVLISTGTKQHGMLPIAEGAVLLALFFFYMTALGMLPYYSSGRFDFLDAFLESVSGFTTTGMSVLPDDIPHAFVLWRSLTQWLGGLSILVALVTVLLPLGGAFGLVLPEGSRAPMSRQLASMGRLAFRVGLTYLMITGILLTIFLLAGANFFDSFNLALVVVSTGGTYNLMDPGLINRFFMSIALMVGMLVSSGNFLLYYEAVRRRSVTNLLRYAEFRAFLIIVITGGLLMGCSLWANGVYSPLHAMQRGLFEAISFATTTGISTAEYLPWPPFTRYCMLLLVFVGGCIGSSSGGMKVARIVIMCKAMLGELKKTLHPRAYIPVYLGSQPIVPATLNRIMGFFFLFVFVLFVGIALISLVSNLPLMEAFTLGVACLSSVAAAAKLAGASAIFSYYPPLLKLVCALLMLVGRLEIFAFFLLFGAMKEAIENERPGSKRHYGEQEAKARRLRELREARALSDSQSGSFLRKLMGGGKK
ncbi:MAG: potassium transporter TrkG [Selenomonadaceae bacterium]|nr:potassium transporter TrkG [Selenomonadaceae bacterium]